MITLKGVSVSFTGNQSINALQDISLTIEKGEWLSVLGPSGSGKTTLLNVISGQQKVAEGEVQVADLYVNDLTSREKQSFRRNKIGFIFQEFRLFKQYSVLENVMIPQWPYQKRKKLQNRAEELLDKVGMSERLHHLPNQLSGGEKQRVSIARALLNNPDILLCDEPTGNLDAQNRERIMSVIESLNQEGITIIMVTHDDKVANRGKERVYLRDGLLDTQVIT